jgi:nucleoside-diphosphate-sugar epimerase
VASGGGHPHDPAGFLHFTALQTGMTVNLVKASSEIGVEKFVHTGSSLEAEISGHTIYENYAMKPLTYRGITKATESMICHYYAHHYRLPVVNARLFGVYGPFEQASRIIPTFIMHYLQHKPVSVASDEYRRDYIFVDDVVQGLLSCGSKENVPPGTLVNLGSSELYSARDIYMILKGIFGYEVPVMPIPHERKAVDNIPYKADTSVARELLEFKPAATMQSGLEYSVEWFRKNARYYE